MLKLLDDNQKKLYQTGYVSGDYSQDVYIKKSNDDGSGREKVFLEVYSLINNERVLQGYIYFFLNDKDKSSDFIGINVKKTFRNINIGSFLVAMWIDFCFNNGYNFLGTNETQRKPFLLYLLKTYGFEIFDISLYDIRPDVVGIYKSTYKDDRDKYLLFRDKKNERDFANTNIMKHDNYRILQTPENAIFLDNILLPLQGRKKLWIPYLLEDEILASQKTIRTINKHKR